MNKKILLVDCDSSMPNLALMKISAHHKLLGDEVGFNYTNTPDIVYASVIFNRNKHIVDGLPFFYPRSRIFIGGSGYDLNMKLPFEIENIHPDYALYPDIDYSLGYSSRGCNRNCHFCIVPEKEGKFYRSQHPKEWCNSEYKKIVFLDNNILLDTEWFFEVTDFCIENNLKIWFTQGLDIRLLNREVAIRLNQLSTFKGIFFAWDNIKDESIIKEKLQIIKDVGINTRRDIHFYVYVDGDYEYDSAVHRCRVLKNLNTNPFVMFNVNKKRTKRIKELQRWSNRKWIFWSCDINEYNWRKRNKMNNLEYELKRAPGTCCPESSCDYAGFNYVQCKMCNSVCKDCKWYRNEKKENEND